MEQLKKEIIAFAKSRGIAPTTVVQNATTLGGCAWPSWVNGGSCEMRTADKIRAYIAANSPVAK